MKAPETVLNGASEGLGSIQGSGRRVRHPGLFGVAGLRVPAASV